MRLRRAGILATMWLNVAIPSAFSQLRNISPYSQDRIDLDATYFLLEDDGSAHFVWASEWTLYTSIDHAGRSALLLWRFKDGSSGYVPMAENIGEAGRSLGYRLSGTLSTLNDASGKPVQTLTRSNPPVRVELWLGKADDPGFAPETLVDKACSEPSGIEPGRAYHFGACKD